MNFKSIVLGLLLTILTSIAGAESIRIKVPKISELVKVEGISLEQVQGKLECVFKKENKPGIKLRRRYIYTSLEPYSSDSYRLNLNKISLTEWMPGFYIYSCAYSLIVLGRDLNGMPIMGDVVVMGKTHSSMSEEELDDMRDKKLMTSYISQRLKEMSLTFKEDKKGKLTIVEN